MRIRCRMPRTGDVDRHQWLQTTRRMYDSVALRYKRVSRTITSNISGTLLCFRFSSICLTLDEHAINDSLLCPRPWCYVIRRLCCC